MAAPMKNFISFSRSTNIFLTGRFSCLLGEQNVRHASKKAAKHKKKRTQGKHYGWKKNDGDYVERGMILYRQLGLQVYPGDYVGCGRDMTLFATVPGHVVVTHEKLSPYPDSPLYPAVQAGHTFVKKFYHVIPDEQEKRFKLVDQV